MLYNALMQVAKIVISAFTMGTGKHQRKRYSGTTVDESNLGGKHGYKYN